MKQINSLLFPAALFVFMSVSTMAQATTTTSVEKVPLSGSLVACNGEIIDFAGIGNLVTHFSTTNSGRVNMWIHGNVNVDAVGQITGNNYVGIQTFNYGERFDSSEPAPYTFTYTERFSLIGQGGVPDLKAHAIFHTTINQNGELTSFQMTLSINCNP